MPENNSGFPFDVLKTLTSPERSREEQTENNVVNLLIGSNAVLECWANCCMEFYNYTILTETMLQQGARRNVDSDAGAPTIREEAVRSLKMRKLSGGDGIAWIGNHGYVSWHTSGASAR